MTDPQPDPLRSFLATFDADDLGDGDLNAGTNTLAAMASMIANIAPPGSGLLDPQGHRTRVGASLLVSGSLSSCLVIDEAITELGMLQDHLTAHLGSYLRQKEEEALRPGSVEEPSGPTPNHSERALAGLVDSGEFNLTSPAQEWLKVLSDPPSARLEDLAIRPKVFVTAVRVAELEGQLRGLQMGRPQIHVGINRAADFDKLGESCTAIMDGRYPAGNGGESTKPLAAVNLPFFGRSELRLDDFIRSIDGA